MSYRSPKNKYRVEGSLTVASKEIGSVFSYTANDIDTLKCLVTDQLSRMKGWKECYVRIWENMKQYPDFDWQIVETYTTKENTHGGKREGSGRKRFGEEKRVTITARVDTKTREGIEELKAKGWSLGKAIDEMVEEARKKL